MFDSTAEIKINAFTDSGKRELCVRWPSDQEWDDRFLDRKVLIKRLGRGSSETTIDATEGDARLYDKIKLNGAPPLTPAESYRVIEALAVAEVTGVEMEGDEATVELTILTGVVHHQLRIPSADQALKLVRSTRVINMPYNMQRLRIGVSAGAAAWDAAGGKSSDYAGAVPAVHKDAAVRAVIEYIDREMGASNDERGF